MRKTRPQEHAGFRLHEQLEPDTFECLNHAKPAFAPPLVKAGEKFPIMAVDQHCREYALDELRARDAGKHLDVGKVIGDRLARCQEADAKAARQGLREASRIDHPVELIERGQPLRVPGQ